MPEDYEIPAEKALAYLTHAHSVFHTFEFDFEKTLTFAMTEKDVALVGFALPCMQLMFECLKDDSLNLQERLLEVLKVQRPEWVNDKS